MDACRCFCCCDYDLRNVVKMMKRWNLVSFEEMDSVIHNYIWLGSKERRVWNYIKFNPQRDEFISWINLELKK